MFRFYRDGEVKGLSGIRHRFSYVVCREDSPVFGVDIHVGDLEEHHALSYVVKGVDSCIRTVVIVVGGSASPKAINALRSHGIGVLVFESVDSALKNVAGRVAGVVPA